VNRGASLTPAPRPYNACAPPKDRRRCAGPVHNWPHRSLNAPPAPSNHAANIVELFPFRPSWTVRSAKRHGDITHLRPMWRRQHPTWHLPLLRCLCLSKNRGSHPRGWVSPANRRESRRCPRCNWRIRRLAQRGLAAPARSSRAPPKAVPRLRPARLAVRGCSHRPLPGGCPCCFEGASAGVCCDARRATAPSALSTRTHGD